MARFTLDDLGAPVEVEDNAMCQRYPVDVGTIRPGFVTINYLQAAQHGLEEPERRAWIVDELNARAAQRSHGVVVADLMAGNLEVRTPASSAEAADWLARHRDG
jgi:hypothetical protein